MSRVVGIMPWRIVPLVGLLLSSVMAQGFPGGPLLHQRPAVVIAQEPLTLEAIVDLPDAIVQEAYIYYRPAGQSSFVETNMSTTDGILFFGTIPAGDVREGELEYYLTVSLANGTLLANPEVDPTLNPHVVAVVPGQAPEAAFAGGGDSEGGVAAAQLNENILIMAPEPNGTFLPENVVVALSLFNVSDVDVSSIRLFLDGNDVTSSSDVSADIVAYTPDDLPNGNHRIEMRATNTAGQPIQPVSWGFRVTREAMASSELAFKQSGRVTFDTRRDEIEGQVLDVQSARISHRATWNWLSVRSKAKLSSDEDPFKPARNRFTANIEMPFIKLAIGDVSPRLNRFALDGKRVRGYHLDLDLKYFKLQSVKGVLDRSSQSRLHEAYKVTDYQQFGFGDTAAYNIRLTRNNYKFTRNVTAIRPSFGSGQTFEWAFTYLKAKDDIASVDSIRGLGEVLITDSTFIAEYFSDALTSDSLSEAMVTFAELQQRALNNAGLTYELPSDDWAGVNPKDNIVIGSDLSLALNKRRIVLSSGFAFSMLNNNIWDPVISKEDMDTLFPGDDTTDGFVGGTYEPGSNEISGGIELDAIPIDPADYEDLFHININMVPLLPIDMNLVQSDPLKAILKMPSMAYHASAKLNYFNNFFTFEYQQVGPEFTSLANPNIQKNVRIRTISDRVRLLKNKLFITASLRNTDDDIVKLADDPITSTSTLMISGALNLGFGLPGINISTRSLTRNNGVTTLDTITVANDSGITTISGFVDGRENTITSSTNIGVTYRLNAAGMSHNLSLTLNSTTITDDLANDRILDPSYRSPVASSNVLAIGIQSNISPMLRTALTFATNQSEFGEGDDLIQISDEGDTSLVGPGMIAQDLVNISLNATLRLMNRRLLVRGGLTMITGDTQRSISSLAPPNFTRIGIKMGVEYNIIEDLRFIASYEVRSRSLEETAQSAASTALSTVMAASLNYTF